MGPADHVSRLVGKENFTLGVVEFFTKCEGGNPLQDSLTNITSQFDELLAQKTVVSYISSTSMISNPWLYSLTLCICTCICITCIPIIYHFTFLCLNVNSPTVYLDVFPNL